MDFISYLPLGCQLPYRKSLASGNGVWLQICSLFTTLLEKIAYSFKIIQCEFYLRLKFCFHLHLYKNFPNRELSWVKIYLTKIDFLGPKLRQRPKVTFPKILKLWYFTRSIGELGQLYHGAPWLYVPNFN